MARKNREELDNESIATDPAELTPAAPRVPRKDTAKLLTDAIKAGGATAESLMELIGAASRTALYGQFSFMNTRGLNVYDALIELGQIDAAEAAQNFPLKGEDGTYFMGTHGQYLTAKEAKSERKPTKTYTIEQMLENAQKRVDKASKSAAANTTRTNDNPGDMIYQLRSSIADLNLELTKAMLAAVEMGEYKYERGSVAE